MGKHAAPPSGSRMTKAASGHLWAMARHSGIGSQASALTEFARVDCRFRSFRQTTGRTRDDRVALDR
jgi:hypothetical protein